MALLGKLVIELAANTARLQSDMGKAVGIVERGASQLKGAFKFLSGGIAGGTIGSAIIEIGAKAIKLGDDLNKAAIKAGVGGKAISELAYAAKQSDVDLTSLSTALKKMQVALSQAASGGKEQTRALQALGLSIEDLQGLKADQQFELLADQIMRLPDAADRARAATELFGKSGEDLLPLFEKGAAGIRQAREEAEKIGYSFGDDYIRRLADADSQVKKWTASWEVLGVTLTTSVLPALTRVVEASERANRAGTLKTTGKYFLSPAKFFYDTFSSSDTDKGKPVAGRRGGDPSSSSLRSPLGYAAQAAAEAAAKEAAKNKNPAPFSLASLQADTKILLALNDQIDAAAEKSLREDLEREAKRLDMADEFYEHIKQEEKDLAAYRAEQQVLAADKFRSFFLNAFDDMVNTGKLHWRELLKYFSAELLRAQFVKLLDAIFSKLSSSSSKSSGGGGFWSAVGSALVSNYGGARAGGGPVTAGMTYLVGEKRAELFRPGVSGTIDPNGAMAGGAPSFAINYNIDARGASADLARALPAILRASSAETEQRIVNRLQRKFYPALAK